MTDDWIELRSDTFSLPYREMYEALPSAPLGDDVYEEDPTVAELERRAAELMGKERALFVTGGSQANLTSLLSQTQRGDEVLVGATSDFYNHETGAITYIGGVLARPLPERDGAVTVGDVRAAIRSHDIHNGDTTLLALENSHQWSSGTPIEAERMSALAGVAHEHGLRVHLDGARLLNAAVALGVPPAELARDVDTVSFCLSKGLCCPAGSLLCGDAETIRRARKARKLLGGGMRQVGWLACAGLVALDAIDRLADDHAVARRLATGLAEVRGVVVDPARVRTNIVHFELGDGSPLDADELVRVLWGNGVRALAAAERRVRMVTHRGIGPADADAAIDRVARALAGELSTATVLTTARYSG